MGDALLHHLSEIALILSAAAVALVAGVFALFMKPKLKELDELKVSHSALTAEIKTLKIPDNLNSLQGLQAKFAELEGRDLISRMTAAEALNQKLLTSVTVLEQSEVQRDAKLTLGIAEVQKNVLKLEEEIGKKISRGDGDNLGRLLDWRVDQLETAYTLSKIRGGTQEEDAREKWLRAKDEVAEFLRGSQN